MCTNVPFVWPFYQKAFDSTRVFVRGIPCSETSGGGFAHHLFWSVSAGSIASSDDGHALIETPSSGSGVITVNVLDTLNGLNAQCQIEYDPATTDNGGPVGTTGTDQGCGEGSGYPVPQWSPVSRWWNWPSEALTNASNLVIWLVVPQSCVTDNLQQTLQQLQTAGPLGWPSQFNDAMQTASACAGPSSRSVLRLVSLADVYQGCFAPRATPNSDWLTMLEQRRRTAALTPRDANGLPTFDGVMPSSLDLTPLATGVAALRLCLLIVCWLGFFVRIYSVWQHQAGLSAWRETE